MVKNQKKGIDVHKGREGISPELIECIGTVCFKKGDDGQPILSVRIDKDKNPKCAKLATKYVLEGREVNFDITSKVGVKTHE